MMFVLRTAAMVLAVVLTPLLAHAECITAQLPKGAKPSGDALKPTLIFSGTVTAKTRQPGGRLVTFAVDRVWVGHPKRETTIFDVTFEGTGLAPVIQGEKYLVTAYFDPVVFDSKDAEATKLPAGTMGISFGCSDAALPLEEAKSLLRRLGPGHPPKQ
jgi:hypothetical protein